MWVQAFHNAEGKEEFGEKPFISMPKKGVCEFLKGPYKERLYPQVKDHSNLPDPEECPIKAVSPLITCTKSFFINFHIPNSDTTK